MNVGNESFLRNYSIDLVQNQIYERNKMAFVSPISYSQPHISLILSLTSYLEYHKGVS